jgi:hypothetical protein
MTEFQISPDDDSSVVHSIRFVLVAPLPTDPLEADRILNGYVSEGWHKLA